MVLTYWSSVDTESSTATVVTMFLLRYISIREGCVLGQAMQDISIPW